MRTRKEIEQSGSSGYGAVVAGAVLEATLDCRDLLEQLLTLIKKDSPE
jgi:hypothetical protein